MTRLPPRLSVAQLPTPVRRLPGVSAAVGREIWVKHDDDTGGPLSGNKIRKLQFAVREAIDAGCDTLITCGGIQSNHCRATAVLARRLGLGVTLCLRGTPPEVATGNLLLDQLLGADIRWWTPAQYRDHDAGMAAIADELRAAGRTPYVVAEGCSMPPGVLGYVDACDEIAAAQREHGVTFDAIVHAVGSGGTTAGLELGVRRSGLSADPIGIPVCDDAAYFRPHIAKLCADTSARYDLDLSVPPDEIELWDGHTGPGYGLTTPAQLRTLAQAARRDGLLLDPVYTSKAWAGMLDRIADGWDAPTILFLHTGGVYGLFAHATDLTSAVR